MKKEDKIRVAGFIHRGVEYFIDFDLIGDTSEKNISHVKILTDSFIESCLKIKERENEDKKDTIKN